MTQVAKGEFFKALDRLYDTSVEQTKRIKLMMADSKKYDERINALLIITERHDRRIRWLEGTDQA